MATLIPNDAQPIAGPADRLGDVIIGVGVNDDRRTVAIPQMFAGPFGGKAGAGGEHLGADAPLRVRPDVGQVARIRAFRV